MKWFVENKGNLKIGPNLVLSLDEDTIPNVLVVTDDANRRKLEGGRWRVISFS